jgi:TRAP-type C4-dicarboxylate transport system permease small subunit
MRAGKAIEGTMYTKRDELMTSSAPYAASMKRLIDGVSEFNVKLGSASGMSTMLLMLIIVPDILLRKFFSVTIPLVAEIAVLLLIGKIFLGLPGAQASGANFHVSFFTERLAPVWQRRIRLAHTAFATLMVGMLAWLTALEAISSTQQGEITFGVDPFPVWPGRIVLAIGLCLLTGQLFLDTLRVAFGFPEAARPVEGSLGAGVE